MEERVLRQAVSGIMLVLLSASAASGATYYVRTDGSNANTGAANTAAGAWLTINYAAGHVAPGDVVRVQAGTYSEVAGPRVSGTAGNTVTLVADGAVTTCGLSFTGQSYIRVIGFTLDGNASGCSPTGLRVSITGTNTGLEFWNNALVNSNDSFRMPNNSDRCNACIVVGGSIHNVNNAHYALNITGDDSFVGYVDFATVCYLGVVPSGHRQRFVNLNFSGFIECNSFHPDFFYIQGANPFGYSNNVVEAMFAIGTVTSVDNKVFHAENQSSVAWTNDIWRFNVVYDTGSASAFSMYADSGGNTLTGWKFYNNDHLYGDRAHSGSSSYNNCGNISNNGGGAITYSVYNSIFYQCWADGANSNVLPWSTTMPAARDYNLGFTPEGTATWSSGWTTQAHPQTNVDPQLTTVSSLNFTLLSSSGARGMGGPLTTASGSGTNSTSLTVAANTGSFFIGSDASNLSQYAGNLVPGDFITVGSATTQVSSVSGDTLTLASPISWSSGTPVYFGSSSTVDIGAYPYNPGGYALTATYQTAGGTATITPNDPSLVRFVVCYSDRLPYAVSNTAPYTCPVPAGTFSATVYPRYASRTLGVPALFGGPIPAPPTGLRIIK
jgi:hypothetical protein